MNGFRNIKGLKHIQYEYIFCKFKDNHNALKLKDTFSYTNTMKEREIGGRTFF